MRENVEERGGERRQIDACGRIKKVGPRSGRPAPVETPVLDMIGQARDRLVPPEAVTCSTPGTCSPALHANKEQPANGMIPAAASASCLPVAAASCLPVAATTSNHVTEDRIAFELPGVDVATRTWPDAPDAASSAMTMFKTPRDRALSSAAREERVFCHPYRSSQSVRGIDGSLFKDLCVLWSEISASMVAAPALAAGGINRGVQSLPLPGHGDKEYADQRRSSPADKDSHSK